MADFRGRAWWARQGLNLRPLRCEHSAFRVKPQKTAGFDVREAGSSRERMVNRALVYRAVTAPFALPPSLVRGERGVG